LAPNASRAKSDLRRSILLIGLPLASGAGHVVHILVGMSLPLAIISLGTIGAAIWVLVLPALPSEARVRLWRRLRIGAAAGAVATAAYDVTRFGVVSLFSMSLQPFHVFGLFGQAFLGTTAPEPLTFAAGAAYHLANGTFFGVAYALVIRRPSWWTGVLWGIGLELCMALLYPAWLRIQVLGEFLEVSAIGHVVYGLALGVIVTRALARTEWSVR
jgi:hypothetical protein